MQQLSVFWSRKDFRLTDNPALHCAINHSRKNSTQFLPVFIIDENFFNNPRWNFGYPFRYYLSHTLASFANNFQDFLIVVGSPKDFFDNLSRQYQLEVFAGNEVEPYCRKRDSAVAKVLQKNESTSHIYADQTSIDLKTKTQSGNYYSVFTPFKNTVINDFLANKPLPKANLNDLKYFNTQKLSGYKTIGFEKDIEKLQTSIFNYLDKPWVLTYSQSSTINLDELFDRPNYTDYWYKTEEEAIKSFDQFNQKDILNYSKNRNSMGDDIQKPLTSRMSVALAWGLVSSRTLKQKITSKHDPDGVNVSTYISELIWREFYRYVIYHNPQAMNLELQPPKRNLLWREGKQAHNFFLKWNKGETGYQVVDAAMHQIIQTGWMHNRARMIVASILTKNLGIDWRWGQNYFRSVLLDLDEASNNGGWQWGASVGSDPKPVRIFNPYTQQEKFDPESKYINHYLPKDYNIQEPIIDHKIARAEALARYKLK